MQCIVYRVGAFVLVIAVTVLDFVVDEKLMFQVNKKLQDQWLLLSMLIVLTVYLK